MKRVWAAIAAALTLLTLCACGNAKIDADIAKDAVESYYRTHYFEGIERDKILLKEKNGVFTAIVERTAHENSIVSELTITREGTGVYAVFDPENGRTYLYRSAEAPEANDPTS